MTDKKWWNTDYPQQYYAFPTSVSVGGYPVAGVTNLDIYSSKPEFLDSFNPDQLIALTQAQYLSINLANLVIKDGALTNYVAPAPVIPLKTQASTAISTARTYIYNNYGILNEPTPDAWVTYLKALMAIANGTDTTSTTLPTAPTS